MLFNRDIKYKDIVILVLIITACYILIDNYEGFLAILQHLFSIISPFVYGLLIAYSLNPIMKLFEKNFRFKRGLSLAATYVFVSGLIVLILVYGLPGIIKSLLSITSEIPRYVQIIQGWINTAMMNENLHGVLKDVGVLDYLSYLSTKSGTTITRIIQGSVSSIFTITANLLRIIIGVLISIYILLDKERLIKGTKTIIYMTLKKERSNIVIEWTRIYSRMVGRYIGIKTIDSSIIGLIALIGLTVIKAPYPRLIALFVGITNMVPYLGPLVAMIAGAFIGLAVSPAMSVTIFILLFALQQFDAWYLDPKLIGRRVGIRPFFVILGIFIGGGYFGVIGMLLASPTVATLKILYDRKVAAFKTKNEGLMEYIESNSPDASTPRNNTNQRNSQ